MTASGAWYRLRRKLSGACCPHNAVERLVDIHALQEVMDPDEISRRLQAETARLQAECERLSAAMVPRGAGWRVYGGSSLEGLFACTTVVDAAWLLRFANGEVAVPGWHRKALHPVLPPWQLLPAEAMVSLAKLQQWGNDELPVGVLSYGWVSAAHPDPSGEQLQHLVPTLAAVVRFHYQPPHACAFGIVWDFLSLPQRGYTTGYSAVFDDRTPEQLARFRLGLASINQWYGHPHVYTLVLNTPMPRDAENATPLEARGWCLFERHLSLLVKAPGCMLELGRASSRPLNYYWSALRGECIVGRTPPLAPCAFEEMLRAGVAREAAAPGSGVRFTSGRDLAEVVIPQYLTGFLRLLGEATTLNYASLRWTDADIAQLARAIEYAHAHGATDALTRLQLYCNVIGDIGVRTLLEVFAAGAAPSLTALELHMNQIGDDGMDELTAAIDAGVLPKLTRLELVQNPAVKEAVARVRAAMARRRKAARPVRT